VLAALTLELWKADFAAPWSYSQDGLFNLMIVKSAIEHGWYLHNSSLGYPFGQDLHDFPVVAGDTVHMLLIKAIGIFTSNPAVVANVFFLITFPLTAAIAWWALRRLGISPPVACACAVLYALAPYHFLRGELHLFLQGYFAVPAGVWLALSVARGDALFERRLAGRTTLTTLAVCLLVATSEVYYAAFTILLVGAAALLVLLRGRTGAAVAGGIAIAAIGLVLVAEHLPTIVYQAQHGANAEVARLRSPYDSEVFGLRPVRLLLPVEGHRLHPLARLTERYVHNSTGQVGEGAPQAIGLVALAGLLWAIVVMLSRALAPVPDDKRRAPTRAQAAGGLALVAVLLSTTTGVSAWIAVYLTDAIRSWARMSIVLAFLGIFGAALLLDRLLPRLARLRWPRIATVAALAAVVALGTLDQTAPSMVPAYTALAADWSSDRQFVDTLQTRLPPNSAVFQLPFFPVPEYGFEQARGYIHSKNLRWSWGAIAGRPEDWQTPLVGKPAPLTMAAAAVTGFKGLVLELAQYPDARPVVTDFRRILGVEPIVSRDARLVFFDIRPYAARLRAAHSPSALETLARSVLRPARIVFGPDWGVMIVAPDSPPAIRRWRWTHKPRSVLTLANPGQAPRRVTFTGILYENADADVQVRWPDGTSQSMRVGSGGVAIKHSVELRPGTTDIVFTTNAAPTSDPASAVPAYLELDNYTLTDAVQERFAKPAGRGG
jgi:phosphoglycerol transferase